MPDTTKIECPDCKTQVERKATYCPECGFPLWHIRVRQYEAKMAEEQKKKEEEAKKNHKPPRDPFFG